MKKLLVSLLLIVSQSLFAQAPIISSFTPKSQIPGSLDTIYGSNFDTALASNLVQFGSARATVISAIASRLIVQVPFGAKHGYITVLKNSNGLKAFSKDKFLPTFNSQTTACFEPSKRIKRRSQQQIAIGDMNLDGKQDLVVVDSMGRGINIYQNINSPGSLNPDSFVFIGTIASSMGANGWCNSIKLADLNGDGKPEVLMNDAQTLTAQFRVIRNNCTIGATMVPANFSVVTLYSSSAYVIHGFDVNDLNADGKSDIALITQNGLLIFRNNVIAGNIIASGFVLSASLISNVIYYGDAREVKIGDLDNDGKNDIAFTHSQNKQILVVKNNAAPSSNLISTDFSAFVVLSNGANRPYALELVDLDADGRLDIISGGESFVKVFRNISISGTLNTSSFAPRMDLQNFGDFTRLLVEDLNGDSKPDLILTNGFLDAPAHFVENRIKNGVFDNCMFVKNLTISSAEGSFVGMDIGDLNQDGLPDVVTVAINDSSMWFYKGTAEYRPVIDNITPNFGMVGDTITINGINFSPSLAATKVHFGNANALVISASATQIKAVIPINAINDYIRVTANGKVCYSPIIYSPSYPAEGGVYFRPGISINVVPLNPMFIMSADLDNDKKPELITINKDSNLISIFRNISTSGILNASSFAAPFYLRTNFSPDQILIADLDMDGKNEIIVNYSTAHTFSVFKNNYSSGILSASSFGPILTLDRGLNGTADMIIKDIDLDGKPDILNINSLFVFYLLNNTTPGILDSSSFLAYNFVTDVPTNYYYNFDAGDLDGDGKSEVLVSYDNANLFTIYKNALAPFPDANSTGMLPYFDIPYYRPERVMIADMDLDGKNDIVVFNQVGDTVSVFKNTSTSGCFTPGSFQRFDTRVRSTNTFYKKILIDINGDKKLDILTESSSTSSGNLTAFINTSGNNSIGFSFLQIANTLPYTRTSYLDDLDGDSIPDMMTGNYFSGSINAISLYKGVPLSTLPVIDYFTPTKSAIGLNDTIYGKYFNPIAANNIVKFGAVRATVLNATKNRLIVKVSAGASYDRISVSTNGSTSFSGKKFLPVFSDTGTSFTPAMFTSIPITESLYTGSLTDIQFDDVDMNGMPDLIAAGTSLSAFKNLLSPLDSVQSAAFPLANTLAFGTARQLEIIDMNGDGKRDITVTNGSTQLNTFTNIATSGPINSGSYTSSGFNMNGVANKSIGDFNEDNKQDLSVKLASNSIDTYRNNTAITGGSISYETLDCNTAAACGGSSYLGGGLIQADLDGDNRTEMIVGCLGGVNNLTIARYDKNNAGFTPNYYNQVVLSTDTTPEIILYGDLDNDEKTDLLIVSRAGKSFCIHKNNYDGSNFNATTFATKVSYSASATLIPNCGELGDIDGDGKVDLAIGFTNGSFSLFRNVSQNGIINSSSFAPGMNIPCSLTSIGSIKIQDINADGRPEVVVAGAAANGFEKVFVYRTNISIPTPTLAASFLSFSNITANSIKVNWVNGNGSNRIVIASLTPILSNAVQNKFYQANNGFGLGDTIGSSTNFVIYNGKENNVTLNGLLPNTIYYFKVIEYNGLGINARYFNTTTLTGNTATLPVTLLNFNVTACGKKCGELNWQTASEINNDKFDILRSIDGQIWIKIGEVKGHGNTKTIQQYQFTDRMNDMPETSIPSTLFYKLKQVDFDGTFAYSEIATLDFLNPADELQVVPNPFTNEITLVGITQSNLKLSLYNSVGQLVFIGTASSNENTNFSNLGSGIYYLLVQNENGKLLFEGKVVKN